MSPGEVTAFLILSMSGIYSRRKRQNGGGTCLSAGPGAFLSTKFLLWGVEMILAKRIEQVSIAKNGDCALRHMHLGPNISLTIHRHVLTAPLANLQKLPCGTQWENVPYMEDFELFFFITFLVYIVSEQRLNALKNPTNNTWKDHSSAGI